MAQGTPVLSPGCGVWCGGDDPGGSKVDDAKNKAKDVAHDAKNKAKDVAHDAKNKAKRR